MSESVKTAVIIGAGPGGLTAAYELLKRTDIKPIILEASDRVGGISTTLKYKGNHIDIGGHRFFSKSDRVMEWWQRILPVQELAGESTISYQGKQRSIESSTPRTIDSDKVMLLRPRKSRIYYDGKLFDYPLSLSFDTVRKLGVVKMLRVGTSYAHAMLTPTKNPTNLEEFYTNQFGKELYETFFREYTEKLWGVSCKEISAEWGAQRVKGLSLTKAVVHFFKKKFSGIRWRDKHTETSLIEQFLYPKYGPGQMWEAVAEEIEAMGGIIRKNVTVVGLEQIGNRIVSAEYTDFTNREPLKADYVFSTMPVQELISALRPTPPVAALEVAQNLQYRDFITVGVLLKDLILREKDGSHIKDTWIYIQEPSAKVCRIQIFNNWSPYLVADSTTTWTGLEYVCSEGDALWSKSDEEMREFAENELVTMGFAHKEAILDGTVIKMKKTYPAYFGSYSRFNEIRKVVDPIENLFLIGRNGMHKYNNQDHSMLCAMEAVDNVIAGRVDKSNLWSVNTEQEYQEEKRGS